jgi:hypothetical protein
MSQRRLEADIGPNFAFVPTMDIASPGPWLPFSLERPLTFPASFQPG